MLKALLVAVAVTFVAPAWADTAAVYKTPTGMEMTIEIAANGNVRASMDADGSYMLTVAGQDYLVMPTATGAVVDRAADVSDAMAEYMHKLMADNKTPPMKGAPDLGLTFVQGGQMTVHGRSGTVWSMKADNTLSPWPDIVMSSDPDLAELGPVLARQFEVSMAAFDRAMGGGPNPMAGMIKVLHTGAPLAVAGMELISVTHTPIAPDRFKLPAEPETREQVSARFIANGGHIP